MTFTRRDFFHRSAAVGAAALLAPAVVRAAGRGGPQTILLKSGWQSINIGDIGHTPGMLRLLAEYLPDARVILWPNEIGNGAREMLVREFPKLTIVNGKAAADGGPVGASLKQAFDESDFLLHGSGPSLIGRAAVETWRKATGKPYGVLGITLERIDAGLRELLTGAAFLYTRDTTSLANATAARVKCPVLAFAPDSTFAITARDDDKAAAFLKANDLGDREFVCAVPRLRYTPYHKIHGLATTPEWERKDAVNAETKEKDHAKLRDAIVRVVRATDLKVLACPEMTYQVALAKEVLIDPLPGDVKKRVVWKDSYWTPDEAGAVYAKALAVVSIEMHSPIIAAAAGTPAMYVRQPTDTCKGQMWRDIGLSEWMFEIDHATGEDIAAAVLAVHADYPAAQKKLSAAMAGVKRRHKDAIETLGRTLNG